MACPQCGRDGDKHLLFKDQGEGPETSIVTDDQLQALRTTGTSLRKEAPIYAHGDERFDTSGIVMPAGEVVGG